MSLFDNMLKDDESLFLNPEHLDFDYQPKLVPHRESHQNIIAESIRPLLQKRNGKNLLIFGNPGVGKTVSIKHVLQELEETTDEIFLIYLNCWKKETSYKACIGIAEQLHYPWIQNKNTEELFQKLADIINKKSVVIILDEFDKLEDHKILYHLLEDIYKKTVILITNSKDITDDIDQRVLSRLSLTNLEFQPYTQAQTKDILATRKQYAFVPGVFQQDAFEKIIASTTGDIRAGLHAMKEAGNIAETRASRTIDLRDTEEALAKLQLLPKTSSLNEGEQFVLELIQKHPNKSSKELYDLSQTDKSFRTFQRILNALVEAKNIHTEEQTRISGGTTRTFVAGMKTLHEFEFK